MLTKLNKLINICIRKNIPFVSYRLPGDPQVITWLQRSGKFKLVESVREVIDHPGFIYAPFHRQTNFPVIFFEPEVIIYNDDFEKELLKSLNDQDPLYANYDVPVPYVADKQEYLLQAGQFIGNFNTSFPKAVLSRVALLNRSPEFDPGHFFIRLQQQNPDAFCHLIHIPGAGTWTGASPEMLIRSDGQTVRTVSLAGTLPGNGFGDGYEWKEKEREEQQIVIDYMENVLKSSGITAFKKTKTRDIQAGDMVHLSNEFHFDEKSLKLELGEFLELLHPTPAVCGLPKEKALDLILKTEKHNREYYAGYCGPVNYLHKTDLFVNLRCMKILPDSQALFVGGGLTAKSDPAKEWDETVLKTQTIRKLL